MNCAECPICMEHIGNVNCCTTECGHTFHSSCLFKNFNNSVSCPLCRKELVEGLDEDEDEEDASDDEEDEDYENDENAEDDSIIVHETEEPEDVVDSKKITINMVLESMKKKGYNEKDFMTLIMIESARSRFKKETIDRNNNMLEYLYKILDSEVHVDYRDSRTYASVVNGVPKTEPRGRGPSSIF